MIYEFVVNPPVLFAKGKITSDQLPLSGVSVVFVNKSSETTDSVITDSNGEYSFKLLEESEYTIHARKAEYFPRTIELSTKGKEDNATIQNDFDLKKLEVEKPIVLEGPGQIFYDYNKYKLRKEAFPILDNVVKILSDNPSIRIELGAHTDARGTDKYNQRLSDKRAKSAFDYIVKKGIKKDRIDYKGFGESMLVNDCKDGVKCTDELHQQNRRTEFKILK
jgi:outer membrane protein OmpA-like peptidoglycan-associated protein